MRALARALWVLVAAVLLAHPAAGADPAVVDRVEAKVGEMVASYEAGAVASAAQERREAYLIFEEIETTLRALDPGLTAEVEAILGEGGSLDVLIQQRASASEVAAAAGRLDPLYPRAREALVGGADPGVVFGQSLFIMVREGFEAILVVSAIVGYLRVSGHSGQLRTVYLFAALALVASLATAAAFQLVAGVGAVNRELLEGITGLLAVAVLFYVSYWLLSKIESVRWMKFIKTKVKAALDSRNTLALGMVSFLAVYREGFETVLFYQALAGSAQSPAAVSNLVFGILLGVLILAAIFLAFYQFGVKIPMREFFAVTGFLLYYLAFTFAGNSVHELQEAGLVGSTALVGWPSADIVGFHPTVETLAAQLLLVFAAVFASLFIFIVRPAAEQMAGASPQA